MTPATIIMTTACAYGLAPSALTGRGMQRRVAEARAVAAFLAYELTGVSYAQLGAMLGRDRTRACRMVWRVDRALRDRAPLSRTVSNVERLLGDAVAGGQGADSAP